MTTTRSSHNEQHEQESEGGPPKSQEGASNADVAEVDKEGKIDAPNTGWKGPIPSSKGGDVEESWLLKPPYVWSSSEFEKAASYRSKCWCGAVVFEFAGDPIDAKYCHCHQCQQLHGAPFQWAVLYHKTSVRLVKGSENIQFYSTTRKESVHDVPCKIACSICRAPLADEGRAMVMAYPSSFIFHEKDEHNESARHGRVPDTFRPKAHIFYKERLMEILDGVPKWSGHKNASELLPEVSEREDKFMGSKRRHGADEVREEGIHGDTKAKKRKQDQNGKL